MDRGQKGTEVAEAAVVAASEQGEGGVIGEEEMCGELERMAEFDVACRNILDPGIPDQKKRRIVNALS